MVPAATATRWVEALIKVPTAGDALATMARRTEDAPRDLPAATRETVKRKLEALPHSERLLAMLEGEEEEQPHPARRLRRGIAVGIVLAVKAEG